MYISLPYTSEPDCKAVSETERDEGSISQDLDAQFLALEYSDFECDDDDEFDFVDICSCQEKQIRIKVEQQFRLLVMKGWRNEMNISLLNLPPPLSLS